MYFCGDVHCYSHLSLFRNVYIVFSYQCQPCSVIGSKETIYFNKGVRFVVKFCPGLGDLELIWFSVLGAGVQGV